MSPTQLATNFAQSVYRRYKGIPFDDISGQDGQAFLLDVFDFANGFIDELETMVDPSGKPIDWKWARQVNYSLGTATLGAASITLPGTVLNVVVSDRYVTIQQNGVQVSKWKVVDINQIDNSGDGYPARDLVAQVGNQLIFSRTLRDYEDQGSIVGDVTLPMPRIVYTIATDGYTVTVTNAKILTTVKPLELLVLGTAKNESLPDIIKGKLSPSIVQKFTALLNNAIARNMDSSEADMADMDDFSGIGGIY